MTPASDYGETTERLLLRAYELYRRGSEGPLTVTREELMEIRYEAPTCWRMGLYPKEPDTFCGFPLQIVRGNQEHA